MGAGGVAAMRLRFFSDARQIVCTRNKHRTSTNMTYSNRIGYWELGIGKRRTAQGLNRQRTPSSVVFFPLSTKQAGKLMRCYLKLRQV